MINFSLQNREALLESLLEICREAQAWPIKTIRVCPDDYDGDDKQLDGYISTAKEMLHYKTEFERGNRLAVLYALTYSTKQGFCVPAWAQMELCDGFEEYLCQGSVKDKVPSLEKCLGLSGKRSFSKEYTRLVYSEICEFIAFLNMKIGFSVPVACHLVTWPGEIAEHLQPSQVSDIYKEYGKAARIKESALPPLAPHEQLEAISNQYRDFIADKDPKLIERLHNAGLLKSYRRTVSKIINDVLVKEGNQTKK